LNIQVGYLDLYYRPIPPMRLLHKGVKIKGS